MSRKAEMICVGSKGTITPQHKPGAPPPPCSRRAPSVRWPSFDCATPTSPYPRAGGLSRARRVPRRPRRAAAPMDEALLREAPVLSLTPWGTQAGEASEAGGDNDLRQSTTATSMRQSTTTLMSRYAHCRCRLIRLTCSHRPPASISWSSCIDQRCPHEDADVEEVGPNNPELVAEVVGPKARMILRDANRSLLILRDRPSP